MKGQIQQVFIYILTIVIVGMVLLIGYKAIGGIIGKGCDVEKATFQTNLDGYVEKYSDYGSVHKESLNAPCGSKSVCFVDAEQIANQDTEGTEDNSIIKNSVDEGIEENVFLISSDNITEPFGYNKKIQVDAGMVCVDNTNGKFYIWFEGLGKKTNISESSP